SLGEAWPFRGFAGTTPPLTEGCPGGSGCPWASRSARAATAIVIEVSTAGNRVAAEADLSRRRAARRPFSGERGVAPRGPARRGAPGRIAAGAAPGAGCEAPARPPPGLPRGGCPGRGGEDPSALPGRARALARCPGEQPA